MHAQYANLGQRAILLNEIVITGKSKNSTNIDDEKQLLPKTEVDKTYVYMPNHSSFEEVEEIDRKLKEANKKAIYNKVEIYKAKYNFCTIPETKYTPEISIDYHS